MLLTLVLMSWMAMATNDLSPETMARLRAWEAREDARRLHPGHRSTFHLAEGARKTRFAVVVVSGLYNSPFHMRPLAEHFSEKHLNVLNVRLSGHFEIDSHALRDHVRGEDWKREVFEAVALARELGEQVLLVGHSTGALLLTWAAIENPRDVAGLVLLAPAFAVSATSRVGSRFLNFTGLTLGSSRLVTGRGGLEVEALARTFSRYVAPLAPERLAQVPVWMLNTRLDLLVRTRVARRFMRDLGAGARAEVVVPPCALVLHDQLVRPRVWAKYAAELDRFLAIE